MENLAHRPAPRRPVNLGGRLRAILALRRQRRSLHYLSDHILDDIGVTRAAAEYEADRPVWDVPTTWRR